ncbi:ArnT family glycosyltransferase [Lysinibacillus fusiformis]|uniref:ArnT family glycosyltransferase n=1 Tax=Lysinibacillus fusiformis TaxID=28031 RepID=UPI002E1CA806|nr:phospholipid carrier-dependent glycosyltransferase [Lysinibacillus fusiformis]MED4889243.1 phospholipid carrier-dependent glycosyltransferase [Lysinibacillus fusiformis]
MEAFLEIFKHLIYSILILLLFWSLGKLIIREKLINNKFTFHLDIFISIIMGMSVVIFYLSLLSILGIVYKPLVLILLLGFYGIRYFKYNLKFYLNISLLLIVFLPILSLTLYPPTHWDDISYHLPIAQSLLDLGNLSGNDFIRYPYFPLNAEMLFTFGMIFNVKVAPVISSICLFTLCIGVYGYIYQKTNSIVYSVLGIIAVTSSQLLVFLSSVSYVDIILATFITAAIILLLAYFENKSNSLMYISGIFLGVAAGIKYTALITCVIAGIIFLLAIYVYKIKKIELFKFIGIVSLVGIPWYIRTYIFTGNPVWPFMSSIFGFGDIWNEDDYIGQFQDFEVNGVQKSISNLLKIPLYLSSDTQEAIALNMILWFGFLIFIVYMKKNKEHLFLLLFITLYTLSWFYSVNLPRYYALIIPTLTLTCVLGFIYFLEQFRDKKIKNTLLILLIFSLFVSPITYINNKLEVDGIPPLTLKQDDSYLSNKLPTYQGTIFSKSLDGKTYALLNENMYYYAGGKSIGDWFGKARYSTILGALDNEEKIYGHLKQLKVDYFFVNKLRLAEEQLLLLDYKTNFSKIYEDKSVVIFELK